MPLKRHFHATRYVPIFKTGEKPGTGLSAVDKMNRPLGFLKTLRVLFLKSFVYDRK